MKALAYAEYGGPDNLKLVEAPSPAPGPQQVLVRIFATSFNPVDVLRASGKLNRVLPTPLPFIPGGDFSGVIESCGSDVKHFNVGDEVFGCSLAGGTYAQLIVADASSIAAKPKALTHLEATSLATPGETAMRAIEASGLKAGQKLLIHGAGGPVGLAVVQLAYKMGVTIYASASDYDFELLRSLGASFLINYKSERFETVATDFDVVIDGVGGEVQVRSFGVLKSGGILVALNQPPSQELAGKSDVRAVMLHTTSTSKTLEELTTKIEEGELKPFISRVYPLHGAATAWSDFLEKRARGKIVFTVESPEQ